MKATKYILSFITIIGFISCNSIEQKQREKKTADSLRVVEQFRIDSIAKFKRIELTKKAFAGSKFGMSIKEVQSLPFFKNWRVEKYDDGIGFVESIEDVNIGSHFYNIVLHFDYDKLYAITFRGIRWKSANYLDTDVARDVEAFKDAIVKSCGEPTSSAGWPSVLDISPSKRYLVYQWLIDTKVIEIYVSEEHSGSEYKMFAEMWDEDLSSAVNQRIEKQEQEANHQYH